MKLTPVYQFNIFNAMDQKRSTSQIIASTREEAVKFLCGDKEPQNGLIFNIDGDNYRIDDVISKQYPQPFSFIQGTPPKDGFWYLVLYRSGQPGTACWSVTTESYWNGEITHFCPISIPDITNVVI